MDKYEEAISALKKASDIRPNFFAIHVELAANYIHLGREQEARAAAAEVQRISPKFCVNRYPSYYKNQEDTEILRIALRKAGLPDCPLH